MPIIGMTAYADHADQPPEDPKAPKMLTRGRHADVDHLDVPPPIERFDRRLLDAENRPDHRSLLRVDDCGARSIAPMIETSGSRSAGSRRSS